MEVFNRNKYFVENGYRKVEKSDSSFCKLITNTHKTRKICIASLVTLTLLLLATINPICVSSRNVEAIVGTATEPTITFNIVKPTASVYLAVSSKNGTFATSNESEKAQFSISTNNYSGYTLTLKSNSNNTNLTNNHEGSINTLPSSTTYELFSSPEVTGQTLNNRWGYIPSYYNSISNTTNYYPSPADNHAVIINSTVAANSADGISNADDYTIGLGVRVNYTKSAGTYTNDTFILEYVANPITYNITFNDNTGDNTVENLPDSINGNTTQANITIPNLAPTRAGYTFNKWCLGTVSNNGLTCTGTEYASNTNFGIDKTTNNANIILYATWTKNRYNLIINADSNVTNLSVKKEGSDASIPCTNNNDIFTCSELTYLDNYYLYPVFDTSYSFDSWFKNDNNTNSSLSSTSSINAYYTIGQGDGALVLESKFECIPLPSGTSIMQTYSIDQITLNSVCNGSTTTLTDNRDGTIYTVTKLKDGNIWLADNLALDLTDSTIVGTLSASNTNATTVTLNYLKGTSIRDPETDPSGNYATSGLTLSNWSDQETYSYSAPMVNISSINSVTSDDPLAEASNWKYGAYYNYCAASAGSYCYGNGTDAGTPDINQISEDICPSGWEIPTGGSSSDAEYKVLFNAYNGVTKYRTALRLPLSGNKTYYGPISNQGQYGGWWSSTTLGNPSVYFLGINRSSIATGDNTGRRNGYNIRCKLKKDTTEQPIYIQDLTKNACQIAATETDFKVYDKRDGNDYKVRYIHGACWMTQNLRITGEVNSQDSNFSTYESVNVCEGSLSSGNSYELPMCQDSSSATTGVWYNYVATTAKTIVGSSNNGTATEDICPAGWHLPGYNTYYQAGLVNSLSSTTETSKNLFSPITGGSYRDGANYGTNFGRWWSAAANGEVNRYGLYYNGNALITNKGDYDRSYGLYIRCVRT